MTNERLQCYLGDQLVEQLEGEGPLPGRFVRIQELDNQGEEDLTLGDQEAVILLHQYTDQSEDSIRSIDQ